MKRPKKIKRSSISSTLPINLTILSALCVDYWKASDLIIGIVFTLLGLYWIACIYNISVEIWIDPFGETEPTPTIKGKSRWMARLEETIAKNEELKKQ